MCTRAFSHESIFIPDGSTDDALSGQAISQENISGKVKTLQQQLTKNINFGQPALNSASKMEETGYSDEIEELPDSPMETHQEMNLSYRYNKVSPVKPKPKRSFPASGTIESINLDAIPLYVSRLDNSAARHKLSVKPKNQRASKKHSRITKEMQHMTLHGSEKENNRIKVHADIEIRHHEATDYSVVGEENHFLERQRLIIEEEKRKQEEHQRYILIQEQRRKEEAEQRRLEEERLRVLEEQKRKEEQIRREEQKHREEERHRHEEEEKRRLLEQQKREAEEKLLHEIEERKRLEQQRLHKIEEMKRLERQKQQAIEERKKQEEQRQFELLQQKQQEEQKRQKAEELRRRQELEEINLRAVQQEKLEKARKYLQEERQRRLEEEEQRQREEERKILEVQKQEQMREELRWQEVDERQTMPRPFTFKVSSGEKIFQKVNLSPVTPMKEISVSSTSKESKTQSENKSCHSLQSSSSIPHTAILVTGAQLCGNSVNLDQIKDTACKSLLGLAEERKHVAFPTVENLHSRAKLKYKHETIDHQSFLNEWESIRSKIMKSAENGKIYDKDKSNSGRHSDDWTSKVSGDLRSNLRKTMSASAKFSITPAWQKFMDTNKVSDNAAPLQRQEHESIQKESLSSDEVFINVGEPLILGSMDTHQGTVQDDKSGKYTVDNSEGCKFAKDLPSFLVPSLPGIAHKGLTQSEPQISTDYQTSANHIRKMDRGEKAILNTEEKTSPFGIKLRRTNYSLRFHCDHHVENKKKKRYSAGDSFDGVPDPLVSLEQETETNGISKKHLAFSSKSKSDASSDAIKDSSNSVFDDPHTIGVPFLSQNKNHSSTLNNDMFFSIQFLHQKPMVAPKPPNSTPPSSPLSSATKSGFVEMLTQRTANTELVDANRKKEDAANMLLQPLNSDQNEEELKERRSFLPSIHIPWREKSERKPDLLRREKPVLQSMHSLDGSRVVQKAEAAQPLWITLALQKQKGFREQQAARDERRYAREAKQVERLANNLATSISDTSSSSSRLSVLQKPMVPVEERKLDTIVSRVERREYLRKSNTLPNSVTDDMSDSVTLAPSVKEVSKRFSTPDATPVSTEPVWLALAKRKAKAWSDCPQIIK